MTDIQSMSWLDEHFQVVEGITRPDWEAIWEHVEATEEESNYARAYGAIANVWLDRLALDLGESFCIYESDRFMLLTGAGDDYANHLVAKLASNRQKMLKRLDGVATDEDFGPHVVIVLESEEQYYRYISHFYPDGESPESAGTYITQGFGHIALPAFEIEFAQTVCIHELTHACLIHLPLPLWLAAGATALVENEITGLNPVWADSEILQRHREFWPHDDRIQKFWSGESFGWPGDGAELSHHLARMAVHAMSDDDESLLAFLLGANYQDGGESAAQEVLGGSLGGLITHLIGPGNWTPRPEAIGLSE